MPEATTTEGNPATFDPSKASLDELRAQLEAPTQVDREAQSQLNPETEEPSAPEAVEPEPEPEAGQEVETPEPEAQTEQEQPLEEEQQPEETAEEEAERLKKMRVRPRDKRDQQVMDLYKSEGFEGNYQDAVNIIYGSQPDPTPEQPQSESPVDPAAEERSALETLNTEIKDLETKLDSASEELDTATALKLQRELLRKENEVSRIETRIEAKQREADQTVAQTLRSQAVESRDRALEMYPALKDADSIERKQFDAYIQAAQSDPAQSPIFQSPRWPEIMANQYAVEKGLKQARSSDFNHPAPAKAAPRRATGTQARQLTSGENESGANAQVTVETVRENIGKMGRKDLFSLLGAS